MEFKPIIEEILKENIVLIYAFNGTGKTRLSVDYEAYTTEVNSGVHAGVYYNAYTEDLFHWSNNDETKLNINRSILNKQHSYIIEAPHKLQEYLNKYYVRYYFDLNYDETDYHEKGIESVSFYIDEEKTIPIKISRGEERIFVWCFFLALFEVSSFAEERNAFFFIDDPVSSLDEHNIHITASTIIDVISANYEKKKIVITTHHVGLFSILIDRLRKADGSAKFKNITKTYIYNINRL
jgi:wobble nucleotide-excising tRNase